MRYILSDLPISVRTDQSTTGRSVIMAHLAKKPDVVVFDFTHSFVLAPAKIPAPTVLFTHNIEAEIFRRHVEVAHGFLRKTIWRNQLRKMQIFERQVLQQFDAVVAVSDRARWIGLPTSTASIS
jgi:hypothetical protein